jgi:hypothetical protein
MGSSDLRVPLRPCRNAGALHVFLLSTKRTCVTETSSRSDGWGINQGYEGYVLGSSMGRYADRSRAGGWGSGSRQPGPPSMSVGHPVVMRCSLGVVTQWRVTGEGAEFVQRPPKRWSRPRSRGAQRTVCDPYGVSHRVASAPTPTATHAFPFTTRTPTVHSMSRA